MSLAGDGVIKNFLFVIGKPHGSSAMAISMYEIDRYMNVSFAKKSIEISQTYDLNSYINCLGQHIFVVHNSKLDYIYYNIKRDELETVAIGRDGKNEDYTPCSFVDKSVVELYVNERQAICRRVYPTCPEKALKVCALSDGADFGQVQAWEMSPTNLY